MDAAVVVADDADADAVVRRFSAQGYSVFVDAVEGARAVDAARLVAARGFARGKSLEAEVVALVEGRTS